MRFPYQQYQVAPTPTLPTGILYRPEVPLRIIGATDDARFFALVDTGADDTIFPRSIGDAVGAAIDDTQRWTVGGIGGQEVELTLGEIDLELTGDGQTYRWTAPVGFAAFARPEDEVAILGHPGFLNFFRVLFDGDAHQLEVSVAPSFPGIVS